jgi:hypothetical protein
VSAEEPRILFVIDKITATVIEHRILGR